MKQHSAPPLAELATCRRRTHRFRFSAGAGAEVHFHHPDPRGHPCILRLHDISDGGVCFVLNEELPGMEVGFSIDEATLRLPEREIRGDLLVMHLTPGNAPGSLCGALFYPQEDADLKKLRGLLAELGAGANPEGMKRGRQSGR